MQRGFIKFSIRLKPMGKEQDYRNALQISIGWLSVISSVIPLALKVILPIRIIPIGKIL